MITAIREVRQAKGLTLADVAARCVPPTTAQTIGRLETGTRTVSVDWLNRIANALGVGASDLVTLPDQSHLAVVARIEADGPTAPERALHVPPPQPAPADVAVQVMVTIGDYRAGDVLWCRRVAPDHFNEGLHRDVLVPGRVGQFAFGRLIRIEDGQLEILPPGPGQRPQPIHNPPWLAVVRQLVRPFD